MSEWIYHGEVFQANDEFLSEYRAFVYVIVNLQSGKRYYGKKRLQFVSRRKVKHRKNRIRTERPSNWQSYWGSSDQLLADIATHGSSNFRREILRFCKSLSESNYYELKFQMENDVLLHPDKFYNAYVGGRISRKQLGVKE